MYRLTAALTFSLAGFAHADVPRVVTDIAPVHALVSQVMDGIGAPDLMIPAGATPHSYAMRPSEARALANADVIIWVGPVLTPWLEDGLETLSGDAMQLVLAEAEGTVHLQNRKGGRFEEHDHDDDHRHGEDHAEEHEDHTDAHDEHDDAQQEQAGTAHHLDPHMWLDPQNGAVWLAVIAEALANTDPENASRYRANATAGQAALAALETRIAADLKPLHGQAFIVFHDAYHYFEARFDIEASAALSESDAAPPSAARLAEIQSVVQDTGTDCVFSEPQFNPDLIAALTTDTAITTATLDPLGATLTPGAALYEELLENMAATFTECLTPN